VLAGLVSVNEAKEGIRGVGVSYAEVYTASEIAKDSLDSCEIL
jgi:hypothetical protein